MPRESCSVKRTCLNLVIGLFLFPNALYAGAFTYNPSPLPLQLKEMRQWRKDFHGPFYDFMTSPDSAFGKKLQEKGDLSLEERSELMDFMECRPLLNLPAVACISFNESTMNDTFVRLSLFKDGGGGLNAGEIAKRDFQYLHMAHEFADGHNSNLRVAREFFDLAAKTGVQLNRNEQSFRDSIMPSLEALGHDNLQILAIADKSFAIGVFSHEADHLLYSAVPEYRAVIENFWKTVVTESDREAIKKILDEVGYDSANERVMIDEFQAYLLRVEAEDDRLRDFVPKYQTALLKELQSQGLRPALMDVDCEGTLK